MILAQQLVVAQDVHLLVLVHAAEHLLGHELLQVRDCRLRRAPDEAALQRVDLAEGAALEAHVHLLVAPVVVELGVRLAEAVVGGRVVVGAGRQVLRAGQVARLVELALALRFVWGRGGREVRRGEIVESERLFSDRPRKLDTAIS